MPSPRSTTRAPLAASAWWSVNGCMKCFESASCHCLVVRVVVIGGFLDGCSDMQQEMLALPWRDHLHELGVLDLLDLGVDGDEVLAQHVVQVGLVAQQLQRLAEAARQLVL